MTRLRSICVLLTALAGLAGPASAQDPQPTADPKALRAALLARWRDRPELHPLADRLAALHAELGPGEQSAEVDPFVYVMF